MPNPDLTRWPRALWRLLVEIRHEFVRDRAGDVAAGITFWLVLSVPSAILALMSALGWLGDVLGADLEQRARRDVLDLLDQVLTQEADVVIEAVEDLFRAPNPGLFTTSLAVTVFSLSRGFAGLIRGLDEAYSVDERRNWFHLRAVAVALSLGSLLTVALTVAVQVALVVVLPGGWPSQVARWLLAMVVLVLWAATVYHFAPYHHTPWRFDVPGAVLAAVVWAVVSAGFELYVRFFGTGNQVLGAVGGAILALTWLYVIVLVLIVGAELNAVLARRAEVVRQRRSLVARFRGWRSAGGGA